VDRHFFDADPDPIRIFMLMPIQIRIRAGIKTVPILMRILAQVLHLLEI
jgi:hypothetical protein